MKTRKEALTLIQSYVNKSRNLLPWLKDRETLSDCAAGYSYCVNGKVTKYIWVHELVKLMQENGTWMNGKPKPGDAVIYSWKANGSYDHVAMFHSKNKLGMWTAFGANQRGRKVTKLYTSRKVVVGWGSPFKFKEEPIDKHV